MGTCYIKKRIPLLTIAVLAITRAYSQDHIFLKDTVYEVSSLEDPRGQVVVHNHTMDTMFVDTIIVEFVSPPFPTDARFRFSGIMGGDTVESIIEIAGDEQRIQIPWPHFPANDIVDFISFCFEYPYPDTSLCVEGTPADDDVVQVVLKMSWHLTNGDSTFLYVIADYPLQYVLPVKFQSSGSKFFQPHGISSKYLINGRSVSSRRQNKTRMPVVVRPQVE